MNLSFDLQLFVSVAGGVTYSDKAFEITDVTMESNFEAGKTYAYGFDKDKTTGLTVDTVTSGIVGFYGSTSGKNASVIGTYDNGLNTWNITSNKITAMTLGTNSKVTLYKLGGTGARSASLDAAGGQTITFGSNEIALNLTNTVASATVGKAVIFKNDSNSVSFLGGSTLAGATVMGASDGAISIQAGAAAATLNLKGDSSEAVVTINGTNKVTSESIVGFSKISYTGAGQSNTMDLKLDGIKDSTVSLVGGTGADKFDLGTNVKKDSKIFINGGGAKDEVTLSGAGVEVIALNDTTAGAGDSVTGWVESAGDTTAGAGNVISLKGGMETFFVSDVTNGVAKVGQGSASTSALVDGAMTTIESSAKASQYGKVGVNIQASDDTYSALLVGNTALTSLMGIKFDEYDYIIADSRGTLDLSSTTKKNVVLANTVGEKHWDDVNVYANVATVKGSKAGGSMIVNGVDSISAYILTQGKNDSIWGANNGAADTIEVSNGKNAAIFSGANDGLDVVKGYKFGDSLKTADAVRFLDGVEYISASEGKLTFGKDSSNAVEVQFGTGTSGVYKVAYGFGTGDEKYIAGVDATTNGNGSIAYDSLASVYIGQGGSNISVGSAAKDVKLGWDGGAGYVSIAGIDAGLAADGAVVVGTTDNEQTITGSSRGASSISGGFVADEWTDGNNDVLIGGNVATKSTTFFVGKKMGKDEIQKLSTQDNIVFLGTKYSDLDNFKADAADGGFTFKFSETGNRITADVASGKKLGDIKDVSLYFDDGTYVWDGKSVTLKE
jgi:hypothetical protein